MQCADDTEFLITDNDMITLETRSLQLFEKLTHFANKS